MAVKGAGGLRPLPARGAGKQVTPLPPPVWLAGRGALRPGPPGWRPRGGRAPPPRSDPPPCGRLKPTSCWNRKGAARPTELTAAPPCSRRRPPPGTAGGQDTVSRAGGAAPGDPFPPPPLQSSHPSLGHWPAARPRFLAGHGAEATLAWKALPVFVFPFLPRRSAFPRRVFREGTEVFFFLRVGADCLLNFRKTQRTKNENQKKHGWGGVPSCSSADSFACGCSLRACSAQALLRCWGPSRERDRPPPALEKPARHPRNSWLASQPTSEIRGCFG